MNAFIEKFNPQTASDELWDSYFDFLEEQFKEIYPSTPFPPREKEKNIAKISHPYFEVSRWLVFPDENRKQVIGRGMLNYNSPNNPAFKDNQHIVNGRVDIAGQYRRSGIGTECLKVLVDESLRLSKTVFQSITILPSGLNFSSGLGGQQTLNNTEYRLYLKDVDWGLMTNWIEKGKEKLEGVAIETYLELPEKDLSEWSVLFSETWSQVPMEGLEGQFIITPDFVRNEERRVKIFGSQWIRMIARNENGAIIGITDRAYHPEQPFRTGVTFTGVKAEWRNRGLGKRLKAEMLYHIKDHYPTVEYEMTGTAHSNGSMKSINERMGFKPVCTRVFYKFDINELAAKLGVSS